MIEQALEAKVLAEIKHAIEAFDDKLQISVEYIGARQPAAAGYVKAEKDSSADVFIAVAMGFRAHDAFSLPTINISGAVTISTRIEKNKNGAAHEDIMNILAKLFSAYHSDVDSFSETFSDPEFYATELRLDGGSGKSFDSARSAWTESFNFTVRGAIK